MWNDASTLPFTITVFGWVHATSDIHCFFEFKSYSPLILLHISKEAVGL